MLLSFGFSEAAVSEATLKYRWRIYERYIKPSFGHQFLARIVITPVVRKNWIVASGLAGFCNYGMITAC